MDQFAFELARGARSLVDGEFGYVFWVWWIIRVSD